MAWETGVQSQVKSDQRLKKWYLMPSCLTLSITRYRSRVKWSHTGKGVPSPTPWCSSYWKGSVQVTLDYSQLGLMIILWYINIYDNILINLSSHLVWWLHKKETNELQSIIDPVSTLSSTRYICSITDSEYSFFFFFFQITDIANYIYINVREKWK